MLTSSGIYRIRNLVSHRMYIGSALSFRSRWNRHRSYLRAGTHHCTPLQNSWNKHGEAAFVFEVVEECSPEMCVTREQVYLDSGGHLYNVERVAGSSLGVKRTAETRAKIAAAKLGKKRSPEACAIIAAACKDRRKPQVSLETGVKISLALRKHWANLPKAVYDKRIAALHQVRGVRGQKHARS